MLHKAIKHDIDNCDFKFSVTSILLCDYALKRFEERFYCHADSEIIDLIMDKLNSYLMKHALTITCCFNDNPKKCIARIKIRINGLLSDLPKFRKHSTSIDNLLILKKNGFMLINDCDRFYNDPDSDHFMVSSESFDEIEG